MKVTYIFASPRACQFYAGFPTTLILTLLTILFAAETSYVNAGAVVASVEGTVTPQAEKYLYDYTVFVEDDTFLSATGAGEFASVGMPSVIVSEFMIPFFDTDAATIDPASITAPTGWTGVLVTPSPVEWVYFPGGDPDSGSYGVDPNIFITPPAVLSFSTDMPYLYGVGASGPSLGGFSFLSSYGAGNGPTVIVAEFSGGAVGSASLILDPPIVLSPSHPLYIPEPTSLILSVIACFAGSFRRRRI